ncbi:MAG TPA: sterol desaturase family protein [Thermoanaerobaculia bacterium]|nr:sterol desaturase family protein [Thermoanaerobaculia bacterium]
MKRKKVPVWISAPLVLGTFAALVWWERRRPLRPETEPKLRRNLRNLAVAGVSAAVVQVAAAPVLKPLAEMVERRRWGLLRRLGLPVWLEVPLALVLLDYSLYLWHVLAHRLPVLWRFHRVHHVDLDLDASTALRFHFGELTMSVAWNAGEILLLGITPLELSIRQTLLLTSILFHHSDVELPAGVERRLVRWIVTPRMHGIHHSIEEEETNSNWSSGLTLWDRLHGTLRLDVPQEEITIGIPAYRDPEEVTLPRILSMPFGEQRPTWKLP